MFYQNLFEKNFKYTQHKFGTSMFEGLELTGVLTEQNKKLSSTNFNLVAYIEKNDPLSLFKTAEIAIVVNLDSEKMILKKFQSDADDDKTNQVYGLEKIIRVDPIEPLKGFAMNSAFSLTTLHQYQKPFKFQCNGKDERDLWIAMF